MRRVCTVTSISMSGAEVVETKGGSETYLLHDSVQIEAETADGRIRVWWREEETGLRVGDRVGITVEWGE